jgi:predicted hydrolase (HD superfamily)
VNREIIEEGAHLLEMDLNKVIEETIRGMQRMAEELGLKGDKKTGKPPA